MGESGITVWFGGAVLGYWVTDRWGGCRYYTRGHAGRVAMLASKGLILAAHTR